MTEFERIYKENYQIVYRYVLSLCQNAFLAEELTQEAFVKAMEQMERFEGKCQLYVWICQIAKNTYYSFLRKQKHLAKEDPVSAQTAGPEDAFLDREAAKQIFHLMNQLPQPYQEVFAQRVLGELSFSQIGVLHGKTDSWARLVYYRAKKRIKEELDAEHIL